MHIDSFVRVSYASLLFKFIIMDQRFFDAAAKRIQQSEKILLVTRTHPSDDSIAALLGLGLAFQKMSKDVEMVCAGPVASRLSFLPGFGDVSEMIQNDNHFVVSVDTSDSKVSQFSYDYDEDGGRLNIYLTPDHGMFTENHVSTSAVDTSHDLVVVVDAFDFSALGSVFLQNRRLFFESPVIVIDASSKNRQFGDVNVVDSKALSSSEVAYEFVKKACGAEYIDRHVASAFLTGIVSKTHSFQSGLTTPAIFSVAGELIGHGADQQHIIRSMYKNKSLETLRLWGQVLLSLEHDAATSSVVAAVRKKDLVATGTSYEHIAGIHDELVSYIGDADRFMLFVELDDAKFEVHIHFEDMGEAERFAQYVGVDVIDNLVVLERQSYLFDELKHDTLVLLGEFQNHSSNSPSV